MSNKPGNPQLILRLPPALEVMLTKDAANQKVTVQTVVLDILGAHYRIVVPSPSRGRPKKQPE